jgi:hypothetical protein
MNSCIVPFPKYNYNYYVEKDEIGWTRSKNWTRKKAYKLLVGKLGRAY